MNPRLSVPSLAPGEPVTVSFDVEGMPPRLWTASHVTVTESLTAPYVIHARLVSNDPSTDPTELLGSSCTLRLARGSSVDRAFHGIVDEVVSGGEASAELSHAPCSVRIVPALALLGLTRSSRIFQDKSADAILREVLVDALRPYQRQVEVRTDRSYPASEYRTQYDESDLAFVLRILGEEGMFFFFEQDGSAEKLVIVDDASHYPALESVDGDTLPFVSSGTPGHHEAITLFQRTDRTRPTRVALRHHDWPRPETFVEREASDAQGVDSGQVPGAFRGPAREVYEHDAQPLTFHSYDEGRRAYGGTDVEAQAALRRHRHVQEALTFHGDSTAIGLSAGTAFGFHGKPDGEHAGEYAVVAITHAIHVGDTTAPALRLVGLEASYSNHFTCVPSTLAYRAPRPLDKPRVRGVLSATVVGPSGEELHTDSHGRIKVQFHWDRRGYGDDRSSCYLRVVQPWAGAGWGFVFLPRIGMEAVVTFLDGDPDRPVVTGTVYNGANPPPYTLPDDATRSVLRTSSTPGGTGWNELSFEDSAGAEEVYLQAQRNLRELVKNDHLLTVLANQAYNVIGLQTVTVGLDRALSVVGNEEVTIGAARTETVTGPETIRLLATRDTEITGSDTLLVHQAHDEEVEGPMSGRYLGGRAVHVEKGDTEKVAASDKTVSVEGRYEITVDDHFRVKREGTEIFVEEGIRAESPKEIELVVGGNAVAITSEGKITLSASSQIELVCGSASLLLKSDGTLQVSASTKAEIASGSSVVSVEPAKITSQSTQVDVSGDSMVNVKGGMVNLN
ncbi:MAG: type VI secretion system tip protein TssI/VgrG [Polyangiales bacterium]